jgi:hypothetical protein
MLHPLRRLALLILAATSGPTAGGNAAASRPTRGSDGDSENGWQKGQKPMHNHSSVSGRTIKLSNAVMESGLVQRPIRPALTCRSR